MKVLIVCSGNKEKFNFKLHQSFIYEQIEAVKQNFNISYSTYFIKGQGILGYLKNISKLRKKIRDYSPNLIHAHYGSSGLLAVMQRTVPVVITFHGTDAYEYSLRQFSKLAAILSYFNIFVSEIIKNKIHGHRRNALIPCGVYLSTFYPIDMKTARDICQLNSDKVYILFSSSFDNEVKNYPLAKSAIDKLHKSVEIIELKNKNREDVNLFLNASNLFLLTSKSEGSPQVIKEAMACNCPIVATDVGDIKEVIGNTEGCYITSSEPADVADKIKLALQFGKRTNGREKIKHLDNKIIAKDIFNVYQSVLGREK